MSRKLPVFPQNKKFISVLTQHISKTADFAISEGVFHSRNVQDFIPSFRATAITYSVFLRLILAISLAYECNSDEHHDDVGNTGYATVINHMAALDDVRDFLDSSHS
jgi:hypothetical protein